MIKKIVNLVRIFQKTDISLYAAQAAFFTILSAVPFLMLASVVIGKFTGINIDMILSPLLKSLPESVSVYVLDILDETITRSESVAVVSVTVISLLWSSSRGTLAIYGGLNNIFGITETYPWLRARIMSFIYNIIVISVIVVSISLLIFINMYFKVLFRFKFLWFFILLVGVFSAIYTYLPQKKLKYKTQLIGAVLSSVGWIIFSYGFSLYVKYFSGFPLLYGSITALALLMLWVYFCLYMFLAGAQINKMMNKL